MNIITIIIIDTFVVFNNDFTEQISFASLCSQNVLVKPSFLNNQNHIIVIIIINCTKSILFFHHKFHAHYSNDA
uniref:Uncharacterized protein n=1 Tax=Schistosoma mansoni TaxID=6183 RepID=A0A5K4F6X7_SCHMA